MRAILPVLTYIRGFLHWFWLVFFTVFSIVIILAFEFAGCKKKSYQAEQFWARGLLWFCGIRVKSKNRHNIPEKPFLIMFNHRSYVDILALFKATPLRFHFGSKKSIFAVPILGFAMRKMGHIPIYRENPREVLTLYRSLGERIKRGDSFALAPEGTRHTGLHPGRFKKGPFIFALNYQIKILPVVLHGAEQCMPKGSWFFNVGAWRRTVEVEYLPALETKGMDRADIKHLQSQVYESMRSAMDPQ